MSSTKKALNSTVWLFSEKIGTLVISFIISVFLARYLAPESFGKLNYLISVMALLAPFTTLGLNALLTKEIVNGVPQFKVLSTAFTMRIFGGLIGAVLSVIMVLLFFSEGNSLIHSKWLIFAAIFNIPTAFYVIEFFFQSEVEPKYLSFVRMSSLILISLAKIIALYYGFGIQYFYIIIFMEVFIRSFLFAFCYLFYNKKYKKKVTLRDVDFDFRYGLNLLNQSKWLIMSGFMSIVYLKIDQVMIGNYIGATEVGVYAVASKLSEVWYFFPIALVSSFFPKLLKSRKSSTEYHHNLTYLCGVLLWMAIVLAVCVSLVSDTLIHLAYGEKYSGSAAILNIHIWAGCFIFMRALLSKWLIAEGLLKFSLLTHGIGALVNIILNVYLIPTFGGIGAAYATLVSYALSSYFVLWFHNKTIPMAKIMTNAVIFPLLLLKNYSSNSKVL